MMRNLICLTAALVAGGFGTAAAAVTQPVTITSVGIYSPGRVDYTNNGSTKNEYAVPLTFTAVSTNGVPFDALGFCVDLAHNISVGFGSQLATSLAYHVAPLTSDGFGNPLTALQIREIGGLATLGFGIAKGAAADKAAQLAAIQQAIWTIEYPTSTFVATGDLVPAQATYAAQFLSQAPTLRGYARTIVSDNGTLQSLITSVGGVPEPAMWVEMIVGLGLVGATVRRRRTAMSVAA